MRVEDLYVATSWLEASCAEYELVDKATKLVNVTKQTLNKINNSKLEGQGEHLESLNTFIEQVVDALKSINLMTLNYEQRIILERLGVESILNEFVTIELEGLNSSVSRLKAGLPAIEKFKRDIDVLLRKAKVIRDNLEPIIDEPQLESADGESAFAEITFRNDASIRDIEDLKKWSDEWQTIARGITMAQGGNPRDVKVERVSNGSILLTISALPPIIYTLAKSTKLISEALLNFQEYSIKRKQMRAVFPVENDEADELLSKFDELIEKRNDELRDKVVADIKKDIPNFKAEAENELSKSVKQLIMFLEKGGDVDCLESIELGEEERSRLQNIREELAKIRNQRSALLLEDKTADEDDG